MTKYQVTFYSGIWHNASNYGYERDSLEQAVRDLHFQYRIRPKQANDEITEIRIVKVSDEEFAAREKSQER